mmetsp:Transcript_2964/g.18624  ORF Transcript_2964/g.18624 Transcript_2964/m.18624 type:complete len:294 (-) Transcript_2964:1527-2408(-)
MSLLSCEGTVSFFVSSYALAWLSLSVDTVGVSTASTSCSIPPEPTVSSWTCSSSRGSISAIGGRCSPPSFFVSCTDALLASSAVPNRMILAPSAHSSTCTISIFPSSLARAATLACSLFVRSTRTRVPPRLRASQVRVAHVRTAMSPPRIHVFRVFGLRRTTSHRSNVVPPVDLHWPHGRVDFTKGRGRPPPSARGGRRWRWWNPRRWIEWNTVGKKWPTIDTQCGRERRDNTRTKPTLLGYKDRLQISRIFPFHTWDTQARRQMRQWKLRQPIRKDKSTQVTTCDSRAQSCH